MRDPLAARAATVAARERSMSERLELALSWNAVAAELRAGLKAVKSQMQPEPVIESGTMEAGRARGCGASGPASGPSIQPLTEGTGGASGVAAPFGEGGVSAGGSGLAGA